MLIFCLLFEYIFFYIFVFCFNFVYVLFGIFDFNVYIYNFFLLTIKYFLTFCVCGCFFLYFYIRFFNLNEITFYIYIILIYIKREREIRFPGQCNWLCSDIAGCLTRAETGMFGVFPWYGIRFSVTAVDTDLCHDFTGVHEKQQRVYSTNLFLQWVNRRGSEHKIQCDQWETRDLDDYRESFSNDNFIFQCASLKYHSETI